MTTSEKVNNSNTKKFREQVNIVFHNREEYKVFRDILVKSLYSIQNPDELQHESTVTLIKKVVQLLPDKQKLITELEQKVKNLLSVLNRDEEKSSEAIKSSPSASETQSNSQAGSDKESSVSQKVETSENFKILNTCAYRFVIHKGEHDGKVCCFKDWRDKAKRQILTKDECDHCFDKNLTGSKPSSQTLGKTFLMKKNYRRTFKEIPNSTVHQIQK